MNENALTDMADKVFKSLHWAAFLVIVSLAILVIDLQLKRSIGRQAVEASKTLSQAVTVAGRSFGERYTAGGARVDRDADHGGAAGGPDVVADTAVAAGDDHPGDAGPVAEGTAPAGPRKRTTGNGRRASGT